MSDFKNVMKNGWHPKGKEGGKESWRGDFKGINQVAGWVGKGKQPGDDAATTHVSRPLASLKDPALFGPPPKNVNYHGGAALPNEITPHRGGLGAPLTQDQIQNARSSQGLLPPTEQQQEVDQKSAAPPLPYRADRTGLRTDNLPPPPKHVDVHDTTPTQSPQSSRPTPGLPPRLPSRQNTVTPPPPPPYQSTASASTIQAPPPLLNQPAINRLGNAGVSVPALGIGKSPSTTPKTVSAESASWKSSKPQIPAAGLSELQSRFSRMSTTSQAATTSTIASTATTTSPQVTSPQTPEQTQTQTPTWQQTRSALTTANAAYKDPSSVSLQDAQSAAVTAQNAQRSAVAFRDRHSDTINAAQTRATQLNKRYNMTGRLNKFLEDANDAHDKQEQQAAATQATQTAPEGQLQPQPQQQQHQEQPQPQTIQVQQQKTHPHPLPTIPQQANPWAMQRSTNGETNNNNTTTTTTTTTSLAESDTTKTLSPTNTFRPQRHQPTITTPQSPTPIPTSPPVAELAASISRKPPPPPPPKKPANMQAPPPVPLGTRPTFG